MRHRPRHAIEYALLRVAAAAFGALPYRAALAAGWLLAALAHFGLRFRARAARARIRAVLGPDVPPARVRRIAWISWRNLCFNVVELARMPRLTPEWIGRHCDYGDRERLLGPAREGRGALVAVPHAGNWDLAGVVLRRLGVPFFFIARRQKNLLADAYLNRLRAATGAETIANDAHLLRGVLRRLRDGGYLGILPDVRARTPGLAVRFLGGTANAGSGMARFARHTGAPVFPCLPGREGWTRHRFRVLDPVAPDPAADPAADALRMTQEVLDRFDRYIRENPEQYFWFNKRWVLDPLDAGAPPADAAEP